MHRRSRSSNDMGIEQDLDMSEAMADLPSYLESLHFTHYRDRLNALPLELLERILESLPTRDLLLSQRVCRKWRSVISSSPLLQQALFLRPAPGPFAGCKITYKPVVNQNGTLTDQRTYEAIPQFTAISQGLFRLRGDSDETPPLRSYKNQTGRDPIAVFLTEGEFYSSHGIGDEENRILSYAEKSYVRGRLNTPLWEQYEKTEYHDEDRTLTTWVSLQRVREDEGWRAFRLKMLKSDPTASWRRMYITQSPVKRLWLVRPGLRGHDDGWEDDCVEATTEAAPRTDGAIVMVHCNGISCRSA